MLFRLTECVHISVNLSATRNCRMQLQPACIARL